MIAIALSPRVGAVQRVLVVVSSEAPQYLQALQGVRDAAGSLPVESLTLGITTEAGLRAALSQAGRDTAIVALGGRAGSVVAEVAPPSSVSGCLMSSAEPLQTLASAQTVSLELPVEQQVASLTRLLPAARSIGILYSSPQNATRVGALAAALRSAGLTVALQIVETPAALPAALERLPTAVDALLTVPNDTIYNAQTSRALLLFSFRHRVPLIGQSEASVKSGALYALDWDNREVGAYCTRVVLRQLLGTRAPTPVPAPPRLIVNLRTAELMHLRWNNDVRSSFDRTFQ